LLAFAQPLSLPLAVVSNPLYIITTTYTKRILSIAVNMTILIIMKLMLAMITRSIVMPTKLNTQVPLLKIYPMTTTTLMARV
jgi:hypothetical protein